MCLTLHYTALPTSLVFFFFLSRERVQEEEDDVQVFRISRIILNEIFSFLFLFLLLFPFFRLMTDLHVQYYATGRSTWLLL